MMSNFECQCAGNLLTAAKTQWRDRPTLQRSELRVAANGSRHLLSELCQQEVDFHLVGLEKAFNLANNIIWIFLNKDRELRTECGKLQVAICSSSCFCKR